MSDSLLRDQVLVLMPTGRENAVTAGTLAEELGISQRDVGAIVADLIVSDGYCIGSLCGSDHGYYFIRAGDHADLEAGVGHTVRRAVASFDRVRALRRSWAAMGSGQAALFSEFEEATG